MIGEKTGVVYRLLWMTNIALAVGIWYTIGYGVL